MQHMTLCRSGVRIAVALGLIGALLVPLNSSRYGSVFAATPAGTQLSLAAQTSREGGVVVKVVPRISMPGTTSWDFEITLETHTQALNQDLTRSAVLIDAAGNSHAPISWEGDPPGGHHRRGLLRFQPLPGKQTAIELRITAIGGVEVRAFRWRLE